MRARHHCGKRVQDAVPDMSKRPSTSPAWARATAHSDDHGADGICRVWDVLDGAHNALIALSTEPKPDEIVAGLGTRFFITETSIKPYSVGYPIQAPLDAFLTLLREHKLTFDNVERRPELRLIPIRPWPG